MSPNVEAVANPLATACESEYIPDEIYILGNPGLSDYLDRVTSMLERIVVEYGSKTPLRASTMRRSSSGSSSTIAHRY